MVVGGFELRTLAATHSLKRGKAHSTPTTSATAVTARTHTHSPCVAVDAVSSTKQPEVAQAHDGTCADKAMHRGGSTNWAYQKVIRNATLPSRFYSSLAVLRRIAAVDSNVEPQMVRERQTHLKNLTSEAHTELGNTKPQACIEYLDSEH